MNHESRGEQDIPHDKSGLGSKHPHANDPFLHYAQVLLFETNESRIHLLDSCLLVFKLFPFLQQLFVGEHKSITSGLKLHK